MIEVRPKEIKSGVRHTLEADSMADAVGAPSRVTPHSLSPKQVLSPQKVSSPKEVHGLPPQEQGLRRRHQELSPPRDQLNQRPGASIFCSDVAQSKFDRSSPSATKEMEQEKKFPRLAFSSRTAPSTMSSPSQTPPVPARDLRLFDAIQNDSLEWKKELFEEYLGLVRGLLIKSMGPQSDVDDLVAEVFVGLFESAKNIRSAGGLRSYVVSVTMNTARREFRRRKRFNLFFLRDEGQEIAERTPSVDDPKAKAALLQLHRILEGLDHEERLIFVLHVLEELPLQEAASSLSVSLSTAKRRLKKANERIRRRVASNPLLSEFVRERAGGLELLDRGRTAKAVPDQATAPSNDVSSGNEPAEDAATTAEEQG